MKVKVTLEGQMIKWSYIELVRDKACRGWSGGIIVGQGPIALPVGAGGGCLDFFFPRLSFLFSYSPSLGDGPI